MEPLTRPLTFLTFRLNRAMGGTYPAGYHAVNIALHVACACLLYDALRHLVPAKAAEIAAALFAVHPVVSEPVNYIWARSTLLMTFFCLLCLRQWVRRSYWPAAAWYGAALLSKAECVAFPMFLTLMHLSHSRERSERKPLALMFALSIAAGIAVSIQANQTAGSQAGAQSTYSSMEYLASQGAAISRYLRLMIVPHGFTIDPEVAVGQWYLWIPILAAAAIAARWFTGARPGFWFIAGLVLLLPSSSIFPADDLAADRRIYLPFIAFAASAALLLQPLPMKPLTLMVAVLTSISAYRTLVWNCPEQLWREAVERSPGLVRPRIWLARVTPSHREARALLEEARKIAPDDPVVASERGRVELAEGRHEDALAEFGRALALDPENPQAVANRGLALLMLGQREAARRDFQRALVMDPCAFEPRHNLRQMGLDPGPPPESCPQQPQ